MATSVAWDSVFLMRVLYGAAGPLARNGGAGFDCGMHCRPAVGVGLARGLPAAEMKHGPIALITEEMPVVFLANRGLQYEKILSNMEEVRSRGGQVIAVASEGDADIRRLARHVLYVPDEAAEPGQERDGGIARGG